MNQKWFLSLQEGRRKYQAERTKLRLKHERDLFESGVSEIGKLNPRELFLIGIALYWAEGFKHKDESGPGLATLDPLMARFYIYWLEKSLGVDRKNLALRVTANILYEDKVGEMEKWWSDFLNVNITQFHKPFFQKSKQKKIYLNSDKYHGVIRIRVRKSLDLLRKVRGWMAGIAQAQVE